MLTQRIRGLLRRATGMELRVATINKAIQERMRLCGATSVEQYSARVQPESAELAALVDLVVVPESWFFRDADAFTAACHMVLERCHTGRYPVRILCVPCAAGEEPYSLAIALTEAGVAPNNFIIHAVDVSGGTLERARQAVYQRNAFRSASLDFRARHFSVSQGKYTLQPHIRQLIQFEQGNLLTMLPRGPADGYDLIFCRNLLIYFDEETQRRAIQRLDGLLREDGVLFVGYAEAAAFCRHGYAMAPFPRAFALVRQSQLAPRPPRTQMRLRPIRSAPPRLSASADLRPGTVPPTPVKTDEPSHAASPSRLLEQARAQADSGEFAPASRTIQHYLQLVPDSAEAHFLLGLVNEQMQNLLAAEDCLRRAVYLDPEHYEALCHLAMLKEQHGEAQRAAVLRQRAARVFERRGGAQVSR